MKTNHLNIYFFCLLFCASSLSSIAQSSIPPDEFVTNLESIAPNIPTMEINSSGTDVFYCGSKEYKNAENKTAHNEWMTNYPDEFTAYATVIQSYIEENQDTIFTESQASVFTDLCAQWAMIFNQ